MNHLLYVSTRGRAEPAGFADILLRGLAPDGGLYVPQIWPRFSAAEIEGFAGAPYAEVAATVLSRFTGTDFDLVTLQRLCRTAYGRFDHKDVVPLRELAPSLYLLELFHGPTLAFKDVAMQILAQLYDLELERQGRRLTIVAATSGDTGGAAVEAFRGSERVDMVVLFPEGRISEVQRRFMTTPEDANIHCLSVAGDFDACQAMVKALFADRAFADEVQLSGVNSINWGRIAAQSVYYFTAAAALAKTGAAPVFATPTGNFGDAYAGYVAKLMGLELNRIVVATNANDILARALVSGRYRRGDAVATQSPAMDIQAASNFERLYFEASGRDATATARAFETFAREGDVTLPASVFEAMRHTFAGRSVNEAETSTCMKRALDRYGVLVDPHTAVGLAAAEDLDVAGPRVVLSTAHPAKFPEAVLAATGRTPDMPGAGAGLYDKPERFKRLAADLEALKTFIRGAVRK